MLVKINWLAITTYSKETLQYHQDREDFMAVDQDAILFDVIQSPLAFIQKCDHIPLAESIAGERQIASPFSHVTTKTTLWHAERGSLRFVEGNV